MQLTVCSEQVICGGAVPLSCQQGGRHFDATSLMQPRRFALIHFHKNLFLVLLIFKTNFEKLAENEKKQKQLSWCSWSSLNITETLNIDTTVHYRRPLRTLNLAGRSQRGLCFGAWEIVHFWRNLRFITLIEALMCWCHFKAPLLTQEAATDGSHGSGGGGTLD